METKAGLRGLVIALFKAAAYTLLFLGMQIAVTLVVAVVAGVGSAGEMLRGGNLDLDAAMARMLSDVLSQTGLITLLSNTLTLFALFGFFLLRGKRLSGEIQLNCLGVRAAWPMVVGAIGLSMLVGIVLNMLPEDVLKEYEAASAHVGGITVFDILGTVVFAPLAEEVVFRGLVYTRLKRAMPVWVAALLSGVLFGVLHGQLLWMIYAAFLGIVMTAVFERTGTLWASILLHGVFNVMGGYVLPALGYSSLLLSLVLIAIACGGLRHAKVRNRE